MAKGDLCFWYDAIPNGWPQGMSGLGEGTFAVEGK